MMKSDSESSGKPVATQAVLDLYAVPVRELPADVQRTEIETAPCIVCGQSTARPRFEVVGLDYRLIDCTVCGTWKPPRSLLTVRAMQK